MTICGLASAGTDSVFSLTSTTAVPLLCPVEVQESPDEHQHRPKEGIPPKVPGWMVQVFDVIAIFRQQGVPAQFDIDIPRVDLQQLHYPGLVLEPVLHVGE